MILTRQNPKGGPALKSYPIDEDPYTGQLGYKVGYCNCGEPVLIRTVEMRDVVNKFGTSLVEYESVFSRIKPKVKLRHVVIKLLGGKIGD